MRKWLPVQPRRLPKIEEFKFVESVINRGMNSMVDPADIEPSALQLAKNATVRFDRTSRRSGSVIFGESLDYVDPVLRVATLKQVDGFAHTVRLHPTTLFKLDPNTEDWSEILPDEAVLEGTRADRFQTAFVDDHFIFTNNGANPIQQVDLDLEVYKPLGNAENLRYITGFSNRVVGAAWRGENEVYIAWSGDRNVEEWDPLEDESAGFTELVDSPSDLSDFIKGIESFTNTMVIVRERSVWMATRQPIQQFPFYFQSVVPGIGCDAPFSITNIGQGLAWVDRRTGAVYMFTLNGELQSIGQDIERELMNNIEDPELIFGVYDPVPQEYSVCIPKVGTKYVDAWTYNIRNQAWTYNIYYDLTTVDAVDVGGGALVTIDGLGETPIDELQGTIDELSPPAEQLATVRVYGRGDGSLAIEDINSAFDAPHIDFPTGIPYETELISKAFDIPEDDIYITEVRIEYLATQGGTFFLDYSYDGGATDDWEHVHTERIRIIGKPTLLRFKKVVRSRRFSFRLRSNDGLFTVLKYEVFISQAGKSTGLGG